MNTKVAKEGIVQSVGKMEEVKSRLVEKLASSVIKDAGKIKGPGIPDGTGPLGGTEKCPVAQEKGKEEFKAKMTKEEATKLGFFKAAQQCGWGIYQVSDLDGGAGSVWYLEKDADGIEYLVKQMDSAGDIVRRVKQAHN